jgi:heat shock protein HslJ
MKRTLKWFIAAAGIIVVLAVAAMMITSPRVSPGGELAGSAWRLTQLNGHAPQPAGEPISLSFQADGKAGGSSGCNSYSGSYTVSSSALMITNVVSTLRACADQGLNTQESEYVQALAIVATYERAGDQLTLRDEDDAVVLVFSRA